MRKRLAFAREAFARPSLRSRLVLILFTTFCIGLAAAIVFFYWEAIGIQTGLRERSLQEQARELFARMPATPSLVTPARPLDSAYAERDASYGYTLYDMTGRVRSISPSRADDGPLPLTQVPPRDEQFGQVFFVGPSRTAAMTARAPDNGYFLVVSRDDLDPKALAGSLVEQDATPLLLLIPFVVLALALIIFAINHMLRPLQRASSQAAEIGPASTVARVTSRGLPAEIIPLVTAFNGALDRLSRAYQVEKRLTADAAHELRTPLAVLRMRLEQSRLAGGTPIDWDAIRRDLAPIDRLTGQLLDLARKEQGDTVRAGHVNLSRIAREAAALMLPLVEKAGRTLSVNAPEAVSVHNAAEDDLRDMTRNLIENALIHGAGAITVAVEQRTELSGAVAVLTVTDEGLGPPAALRATVFERFRKGDSATPGAGLGLAIVRHVAESHGGDAAFIDGQSCAVRITLPLSLRPISG